MMNSIEKNRNKNISDGGKENSLHSALERDKRLGELKQI